MNKRSLVCLLSAAMFLTAGCYEDDSAWAPDSSAIVYLNEAGELIYYSVKQQASTTIAKLNCTMREGPFEKPAISPDGKRVAVVRHTFEGRSQLMQVIVCDMKGGVIKRSKSFRLPDSKTSSAQGTSFLGRAHWSPCGRYILCCLDAQVLGQVGRFFEPEELQTSVLALYDLELDRAVVLPRLKESLLTAVFGVSPFSQDKRGFLAEQTGAENEGLDGTTFVDWNGKCYPFRSTAALKQAAVNWEREQEKADQPPDLALRENMTRPSWSRSLLVWPFFRGKVVFDTRSRLADYRADENVGKIWEYTNSRRSIVSMVRDGLLIVVEPTEEAGKRKKRIEFVIRKSSNGKFSWESIDVMTVSDVEGIIPSPDGKTILIHYSDGDQCGRLILDDRGKILADLK